MAFDSAKRICSGTWGAVWLDGEKVAECYGAQAKMTFNKEEVHICGQMAADVKVTGMKGSGSLRLHKVNSRMAGLIAGRIQDGVDVRFTLVLKLGDPDANGTERVVLYNVSFDDLTLADWEARALGRVECPFTFTRYEYQDTIPV